MLRRSSPQAERLVPTLHCLLFSTQPCDGTYIPNVELALYNVHAWTRFAIIVINLKECAHNIIPKAWSPNNPQAVQVCTASSCYDWLACV